MRVLKIGKDLTAVEIDIDEEDLMDDERIWDTTDLDSSHDIWFDDEGMSDPGVVYATIGDKKVPLPAYVIGVAGERPVDATIGIDELMRLIS